VRGELGSESRLGPFIRIGELVIGPATLGARSLANRPPDPVRGQALAPQGLGRGEKVSPLCLNEAADARDAPPCLSTGDEAGDDVRR
jgi:hypothetical protein